MQERLLRLSSSTLAAIQLLRHSRPSLLRRIRLFLWLVVRIQHLREALLKGREVRMVPARGAHQAQIPQEIPLVALDLLGLTVGTQDHPRVLIVATGKSMTLL